MNNIVTPQYRPLCVILNLLLGLVSCSTLAYTLINKVDYEVKFIVCLCVCLCSFAVKCQQDLNTLLNTSLCTCGLHAH